MSPLTPSPDRDLPHLLDLLTAELGDLRAASAPALDAQWTAAPRVTRPHPDTADRKAQGGHGDPTADAALDGRRLALRAQVLRSERLLEHALVLVRGVRRGLELSVDHWQESTRDTPEVTAE